MEQIQKEIKVGCYWQYGIGDDKEWKFFEVGTGALLHSSGTHFTSKQAGIKALTKVFAAVGMEKILREIEKFWEMYPNLKGAEK